MSGMQKKIGSERQRDAAVVRARRVAGLTVSFFPRRPLSPEERAPMRTGRART